MGVLIGRGNVFYVLLFHFCNIFILGFKFFSTVIFLTPDFHQDHLIKNKKKSELWRGIFLHVHQIDYIIFLMCIILFPCIILTNDWILRVIWAKLSNLKAISKECKLIGIKNCDSFWRHKKTAKTISSYAWKLNCLNLLAGQVLWIHISIT